VEERVKLTAREHAAHQTTRSASQVFANAGVAGLAGLLCLIWTRREDWLQIAMAASFASATADTLSSELGMVYGRRFYHVLTFQRDQKGLDGVISLEGTIIGMIAAAVIAVIFVAGHPSNSKIFWVIVASGTAGNLMDSLLGATLERKKLITNDMVNFLNTLAAAIISLGLISIFP
jgi:uncharacterized protein (TIGR00297 family)